MLEALLVVLFVLIVGGLIVVGRSMRVVQQYERGLIFRFGKVLPETRGPGLTIIRPVGDKLQKVNMQIVAMAVPAQEGITRDNVSVRVDAVVYFRVVDPIKAVINVQNYMFAVSQQAQTSLRSIIGQSEMDQLLAERETVNRELRRIIDEPTEGPWGIRVERVEIKDVNLPEGMKRSMSRQAEAERERRARIITADGEYQASKRLAAAANVGPKSQYHWRMTSEPHAAMSRACAAYCGNRVTSIAPALGPYPDSVIAGILNRQGRATAYGHRFTAGRVGNLRRHWGIPCFQQTIGAPEGELLTIKKAAVMLGVAPSTIHRLLNDGIIAGEQLTPGAPWRIRLTKDLKDRFNGDAGADFLPMREAIRALGISRQTVLQRVKRGELAAVHVMRGKQKRPAYQRDRPTARPLRSHLMNQGAVCSTFQEIREVGIDDFPMSAKQQFFDLDRRLLGIPPRPVGVLFGWKIGFEDRFQHQRCRRHADPIPHARGDRRVATPPELVYRHQLAGRPSAAVGKEAR